MNKYYNDIELLSNLSFDNRMKIDDDRMYKESTFLDDESTNYISMKVIR